MTAQKKITVTDLAIAAAIAAHAGL